MTARHRCYKRYYGYFIPNYAKITAPLRGLFNCEKTRRNATLTRLKHAKQVGLKEQDEELSPYLAQKNRHDLHIADGVIYCRKRLIALES